MKNNEVIFKDYFCGNRISDYGREHGRVDYATLAASFQHVLNNEKIIPATGWENWEVENGTDYDEETDEYNEVFQYYIISDQGAEILKDYTDEILYYNQQLDMYVWGVTHWGTSWDYVLTDIRCEKETKTA